MLTELKAMTAAVKAGTLVAVGLGLIALGAAGAEVYEHTAPWGLGPKRDALAARIDGPKGLLAQLGAMTADRDAWIAAEGRCEGQRGKEAGDARAAILAASEARSAAASSAFDQGYAAGRAVGRRSCGATPDVQAPSPAAGRPPAGVLRDDDFAAAWSDGAYRP